MTKGAAKCGHGKAAEQRQGTDTNTKPIAPLRSEACAPTLARSATGSTSPANMITHYSTMVRIVRPQHADRFRIKWTKQGIDFDFALPVERMQMLYSGLIDAVRKADWQEANVFDPDYRRGARLADHVRYFAKWDRTIATDFRLYFFNGLRFKPARVSYLGMVRCDRPDLDGEYHSGRVLFSPKGLTQGDGATDSSSTDGSTSIR